MVIAQHCPCCSESREVCVSIFVYLLPLKAGLTTTRGQRLLRFAAPMKLPRCAPVDLPSPKEEASHGPGVAAVVDYSVHAPPVCPSFG